MVYGSRGFDTFGETFMLLAAVVSVTLLSPGPGTAAEYVGEARRVTGNRPRSTRRSQPTRSGGNRSAERQEDDAPGDADRTAARPAIGFRSAVRSSGAGRGDDRGDPRGGPGRGGVPVRGRDLPGGLGIHARAAAFPAARPDRRAVLLYAALGHRGSTSGPADVLEPVELAAASVSSRSGCGGLMRHGSMFANFLPLAEPGNHPGRRQRAAVLRRRADRGGHRPGHRDLQPARPRPTTGRRTRNRGSESRSRPMIVVQLPGRGDGIRPGNAGHPDAPGSDQDRARAVADGILLLPAAGVDGLPAAGDRTGARPPHRAGRLRQSLVEGAVSDPVLQNFCLTAIVIGVADHRGVPDRGGTGGAALPQRRRGELTALHG